MVVVVVEVLVVLVVDGGGGGKGLVTFKQFSPSLELVVSEGMI